jgi:hypothetical protein
LVRLLLVYAGLMVCTMHFVRQEFNLAGFDFCKVKFRGAADTRKPGIYCFAPRVTISDDVADTARSFGSGIWSKCEAIS